MNPKEVARNACHRLRCKLQHDVSKKVELDSECPCFDEFPVRRFELAPKLQTEKFPGDLQDAEYLFVLVFNFVKNFFSARNREDAAQRLQKFVYWEVSFEETFHCKFAVLAWKVHGLHHRSKPYRFSLAICDLN
jgi:hypothetical protein